MTERKYHRLPGRHSRSFSYETLWSTDDHILLVRNNGYVERYQRYYFKDIQGFLVKPSLRFRRLNLWLGVSLLLLLLNAGWSAAWAMSCAVLAIPLFLLLLINWIKGPSCDTYVCTAVADVLLTPLGRQRAAFDALKLIQRSIVQSQGSVSAAELGLGAAAAQNAAGVSRSKAGEFKQVEPIGHADATGKQQAPETLLWFLAAMEVLLGLAAGALLILGGSALLSWLYFPDFGASVGGRERDARPPTVACATDRHAGARSLTVYRLWRLCGLLFQRVSAQFDIGKGWQHRAYGLHSSRSVVAHG